MRFGLQSDMTAGKFEIRTMGNQRFGFLAFRIQPGLRISQHLLAANSVDNLFVTTDLDFDRDPFVCGQSWTSRFYDVLFSKLSAVNQLGARSANVAGLTSAFALVGQNCISKLAGKL